MLMVTNSIEVIILIKSLLLPITEEIRECTGHASTQIENFSESLIAMSGCLRELKNKGKGHLVIHKRQWSQSLTGAVA